MPQLDRVVIFTQIFWLFVIFSGSYIILTHFFFPLFLKTLKSRNLVIQANFNEAKEIQKSFLQNQLVLNQVLSEGLSIIKFFYSKDFLLNTEANKAVDTSIIDSKLALVILNTMLYCDSTVLNLIPLNAKPYNLSYSKN